MKSSDLRAMFALLREAGNRQAHSQAVCREIEAAVNILTNPEMAQDCVNRDAAAIQLAGLIAGGLYQLGLEAGAAETLAQFQPQRGVQTG